MGMLRSRDLKAHNIPRAYLQRLLASGDLQKSGRGVYLLADAELTENYSLVEACKRIPDGVVCLLSALRFHNIGTQSPYQVWIAIHPKSYLPRIDYPPVHVVRFSGPILSAGVEEHQTSEGTLRVYSAPKTVADCFRYRNKIGLDVAIEALRACWHEKRATMDQLWHFAAIDKVSKVMRPYLESLV
jgi:predicted transcriptional regulator of viral defense system